MNLSVYYKEFGYNIRLAYPIILAMLGHTIVGVIDNIMVGKIGATELAAASLANSFVFIAVALGVGFSTALTPLVAHSDAEKDVEGGRSIFINGLALCTILGVVLFSIIFFAKPLLMHMGQPEEVTILAKPFLDIVALSLIPLVMYQSYKQFADGKSQTKNSMYATIIANLTNIVFNYLLIYGVWIFPELGMLGAAYGTLISRIVMIIYMHFALKRQEMFKSFLSHIKFHEIKKEMLLKITKIGVPSGMMSFFEVALFVGAVWLSGMIGTEAQAANQIALSMSSMTFMFASGLSVAAMIRVGNQRGLKDYVKLRVVARSIILMAVIIYTGFAILFVLFHQYIPMLFLDNNDIENAVMNQEVIKLAGTLLLVAAVFQISDCIQVVTLGALRGLQDVNMPMGITFVSYWIIGFPISIYLGLYTSVGAAGIWIGLLAGLTTAAICLYWRFHKLSNRLINNN
ncbi:MULTISPECIES: MATE family efflux transporter [Myroides]|uniref:Multidrug-efflux transporter n=3 Tax=Myroides odoratimimus TaxID=76832 RepID=A0AAI8C5N1_9FLAO|nr:MULTISPECIES: MATE family efflux transporter [Myroides]ALU26484.1 MATE family efflux transporter [Myroides odoratimimus]APA92540.1 MATE family efflux transporter [Myroides sp. ZB35]EHO12027.1 MATE efflux family protein [Myroides odoratimimus CCUG 10230]EHO13197.1 MATE efflux family protein [Myroides odoratimimus CCUG 12901]EHO13993.1 MATE efflux family protein [Myroides odoratimimus CIP 101113]